MLNIAVDTEDFYTWGGGVDFIASIVEGLQQNEDVGVYLLVRKDSMLASGFENLKRLITCLFDLKQYAVRTQQYKKRFEMLDAFVKNALPEIRVLEYKSMRWTKTEKINKLLDAFNIDIIFPTIDTYSSKMKCPRVGYLYDFQHKYLSSFFSVRERVLRNIKFGRIVNKNKYLLVNAKNVKKDIDLFYPNHKCRIITLPFLPFQMPNLELDRDLTQYGLPEKYFIVSNQFWKHKSHKTVFDAMEKLYKNGYTDIHLVCTGKVEDYRDSQYGKQILQYIKSLKCSENIHILGYIPKSDQVLIMYRSIALVQPTLFEGGPGGGAVYNALALGVPCIVSDIDVNKEIVGYDDVFFFKAGDENDLAECMKKHLVKKNRSLEDARQRNEENKKIYGRFIYEQIKMILGDVK